MLGLQGDTWKCVVSQYKFMMAVFHFQVHAHRKKSQDCNNEVVETERGDIKSLQRKGPSNMPLGKKMTQTT
jgi:hypothetical protein